MSKVATILSSDASGQKSISLMLTRDALFLDPDGIPSPGIALSGAQARALAARLLNLADEAEQSEARTGVGPSSAILVVHDGTSRGDRAFALALTMAHNSDAMLHLHVRKPMPWRQPTDDLVESCARQLNSVPAVAERCAAEAARYAVHLALTIISLDEHGGLIVPSQNDFDFLILPQSENESDSAFPATLGRYVVLVR